MDSSKKVQVITHKIEAGIDDHVFIVIERPDRPTCSLDLTNTHGRAYLSVRSNGMGIGGHLIDVSLIEPKSEAMMRFCPYCGEKLNLISSGIHTCETDVY